MFARTGGTGVFLSPAGLSGVGGGVPGRGVAGALSGEAGGGDRLCARGHKPLERQRQNPPHPPPIREQAASAGLDAAPYRIGFDMALQQQKSSSAGEFIKTIVYAGLIAVGIHTFLFEPFFIPSGSMVPTLLVGDYLFVNKFAYGYSHFSLPFSPDFFSGRVFGRMPARGTVVVFRPPGDPNTDYIKRVI